MRVLPGEGLALASRGPQARAWPRGRPARPVCQRKGTASVTRAPSPPTSARPLFQDTSLHPSGKDADCRRRPSSLGPAGGRGRPAAPRPPPPRPPLRCPSHGRRLCPDRPALTRGAARVHTESRAECGRRPESSVSGRERPQLGAGGGWVLGSGSWGAGEGRGLRVWSPRSRRLGRPGSQGLGAGGLGGGSGRGLRVWSPGTRGAGVWGLRGWSPGVPRRWAQAAGSAPPPGSSRLGFLRAGGASGQAVPVRPKPEAAQAGKRVTRRPEGAACLLHVAYTGLPLCAARPGARSPATPLFLELSAAAPWLRGLP